MATDDLSITVNFMMRPTDHVVKDDLHGHG